MLADGGLLAVSSPNRDVYPPGNQHHVREYLPEELRDSLARRFANVRLVRQHSWTASTVLTDESLTQAGETPVAATVTKTGAIEPGEETFTVGLSTDAELPALDDLVVVGAPLDQRALAEAAREAEEQHVLLEKHWERVAELEKARKRLIEAEQELAELPALMAARRDLDAVKESLSWRITAPLRRVTATARGLVPPLRGGLKRALLKLLDRARR